MRDDYSALPRIGPLQYEPRLDQFTGEVLVDGTPVSVLFDRDRRHLSEGDMELGERFCRGLETLCKEAMDRICADMLVLKNSNWLQDGEWPLSEMEFRSRLKLIDAWLNRTGSCRLTFEDGGMFWGHDIMVDITAEGLIGKPYLYG